MTTTIRQATARIRSNRGSSFLTRGADNYDHKGLNAARRVMDRAVIAEQMADMADFDEDSFDRGGEPDYKWKVVAFFYDGDKSYLDAWYIVGLFDTREEAENCTAYHEQHAPANKQPYWEQVDINEDYDADFWLREQRWLREHGMS